MQQHRVYDAEKDPGQHLNGRMADELLELDLRELPGGKIVEGLHDLVDDGGLPAGFEPDAHRILAYDHGQNRGDGERKGVKPVDKCRGDSERGYGCGVTARHTAVTDETGEIEPVRDERVEDRFEDLRPQPRRNAGQKKPVGDKLTEPHDLFHLCPVRLGDVAHIPERREAKTPV